jgi:hypothetical protein
MWKFILAGTAVLAIASTSFLYAEQVNFVNMYRPTDPNEGQLWQSVPRDLQGFDEARLAALKSGLMLTPEQARNWPAFEQAARDFHSLRMEHRMAARTTLPSNDPLERLQQRAIAMSEIAAALETLAKATKPLYSSLDENQKRRFVMLDRLSGLDRNYYRN